ncbi:histidinol-phosphate transaminase [Paenibacillus xylaniclasticus]|uniref:histidinol-phosphate transaminase n=1 Tax=Paenibacillus xylaniclasticus TaxID=588083 RepID=UPI000FDC8F1B|nr:MULTISPECIES: histidinol-phosphate transaminase [Paenibacillus]GFN30773.1 histidinol-phosphate aminotransferase 2 [Paenibacillus curdlanolyticus]
MTFALPHVDRIIPYPSITLNLCQPMIKLDQNENPYPPAPSAIRALASANESTLRLYPDASCLKLREALARQHNVPVDRIVIGNGSSELIAALFHTFVGNERTAALPYPTFAMYETAAAAANARVIRVQTNDDYVIDPEELCAANAAVIALVNPNAPTGRLLRLEEIERIAASTNGVLFIDEAYIHFAGEAEHSAIPLTQKYDNLVVLRTFSKAYALSGARIGYAIGSRPIIEAFEKTKPVYNVNGIGLSLASGALEDEAYLQTIVQAVRTTRDQFVSSLQRIGFQTIPSETNFILCSPPVKPGAPDAPTLVRMLAEHGFAVRYFDLPRLQDKVRISIGTDAQMNALSAQLEHWYT